MSSTQLNLPGTIDRAPESSALLPCHAPSPPTPRTPPTHLLACLPACLLCLLCLLPACFLPACFPPPPSPSPCFACVTLLVALRCATREEAPCLLSLITPFALNHLRLPSQFRSGHLRSLPAIGRLAALLRLPRAPSAPPPHQPPISCSLGGELGHGTTLSAWVRAKACSSTLFN